MRGGSLEPKIPLSEDTVAEPGTRGGVCCELSKLSEIVRREFFVSTNPRAFDYPRRSQKGDDDCEAVKP